MPRDSAETGAYSMAESAMQDAPALSSRGELTDHNIDFIAQAGFGLSDVFHTALYLELDLVLVPLKPVPMRTEETTSLRP